MSLGLNPHRLIYITQHINPFLKIEEHGLDTRMSKKAWEDSIPGYVYLALEPDVAFSYAESSEEVPDEWIDQIIILKIDRESLDLDKLFIDQNVSYV